MLSQFKSLKKMLDANSLEQDHRDTRDTASPLPPCGLACSLKMALVY
jgi:hypothetical protein